MFLEWWHELALIFYAYCHWRTQLRSQQGFLGLLCRLLYGYGTYWIITKCFLSATLFKILISPTFYFPPCFFFYQYSECGLFLIITNPFCCIISINYFSYIPYPLFNKLVTKPFTPTFDLFSQYLSPLT